MLNYKYVPKYRKNIIRRFDLHVVLVGTTVGIGNLANFPSNCLKYGFVSFVIPYAFFMALVGAPAIYLEISLGKFTGRGIFSCWEFSPFFRGLGVSICIILLCSSMFYSMLITWAVVYLAASFETNLPWGACRGQNWANKELCEDEYNFTDSNCDGYGTPSSDGVCVANSSHPKSAAMKNHTFIHDRKTFESVRLNGMKLMTASNQYWSFSVRKMPWNRLVTAIPTEFNMICGIAYCCLWIVIGISLVKGIRSLGKIVYVTCTCQYLCLLIFLSYSLTLPGSGNGLIKYFTPKWDTLISIQIYVDALYQVIYTLGIGYGMLITSGSHIQFIGHVYPFVITIVFANVLTSFLTCLVSSSLLGYYASLRNIGVDDERLAGQTTTMLFVVYPEVFANLDAPKIFIALFYIMVVLFGIDTMYAMVEAVQVSTVGISEFFDRHAVFLMVILCSIPCFIGLILSSDAGIIYYVVLRDAPVLPLLVVGLVMFMVIHCTYGIMHIACDFNVMFHKPMSKFWPICWFIDPLIFLGVIILYLYNSPSYIAIEGAESSLYIFILFHAIEFAAIITIPLFGIFVAMKRTGGRCGNKIHRSLHPTVYWGPCDLSDREIITNLAEITRIPGFVYNPYEFTAHDRVTMCAARPSITSSVSGKSYAANIDLNECRHLRFSNLYFWRLLCRQSRKQNIRLNYPIGSPKTSSMRPSPVPSIRIVESIILSNSRNPSSRGSMAQLTPHSGIEHEMQNSTNHIPKTSKLNVEKSCPPESQVGKGITSTEPYQQRHKNQKKNIQISAMKQEQEAEPSNIHLKPPQQRGSQRQKANMPKYVAHKLPKQIQKLQIHLNRPQPSQQYISGMRENELTQKDNKKTSHSPKIKRLQRAHPHPPQCQHGIPPRREEQISPQWMQWNLLHWEKQSLLDREKRRLQDRERQDPAHRERLRSLPTELGQQVNKPDDLNIEYEHKMETLEKIEKQLLLLNKEIHEAKNETRKRLTNAKKERARQTQ